jgi:hypothetical protein
MGVETALLATVLKAAAAAGAAAQTADIAATGGELTTPQGRKKKKRAESKRKEAKRTAAEALAAGAPQSALPPVGLQGPRRPQDPRIGTTLPRRTGPVPTQKGLGRDEPATILSAKAGRGARAGSFVQGLLVSAGASGVLGRGQDRPRPPAAARRPVSRAGAEAAERERLRATRGRGRRGTILTSPLGVRGQGNVAVKSLLGQ